MRGTDVHGPILLAEERLIAEHIQPLLLRVVAGALEAECRQKARPRFERHMVLLIDSFFRRLNIVVVIKCGLQTIGKRQSIRLRSDMFFRRCRSGMVCGIRMSCSYREHRTERDDEKNSPDDKKQRHKKRCSPAASRELLKE